MDGKTRKKNSIELLSVRATRWVGSTQSLIVHTIIFVFAFFLVLIGVGFDKVLLVLTTIVSLEAIYLSIFIQMSVNRSNSRLREVSKDIDEIQEDIEGIEKDVDEIQKDIDDIQEDVEEIGEDVEEIGEDLDEDDKRDEDDRKFEVARYERIEGVLQNLLGEIQTLKAKNKVAKHKTQLKK